MKTRMNGVGSARALFLGGALAAVGALPAFGALVADGGFEDTVAVNPFQTVNTTIGAWNVTAGSVDFIGNYWQAAEGIQSVDMSGNENGTISQMITLARGTYKLTFAQSGNFDGPPALKQLFVSLGGAEQEFDYLTVPPNGGGIQTHQNMNWVTRTAYFTVGTSGSFPLAFRDGSVLASGNPVGPDGTTPWGVALDNVSLVAVPEASTYLAGAGSVGIMGIFGLMAFLQGRSGKVRVQG